jgi:uncharacterized protein YdaT
MKRLDPPVREKAIEIANALLDAGHPEGQAIRIGIARAREWAEHRGITTSQRVQVTRTKFSSEP